MPARTRPYYYGTLMEALVRVERDASNPATARADVRDVRQTLHGACDETDYRGRRHDAEDSNLSQRDFERAKAALARAAAAAHRVALAHGVPGLPPAPEEHSNG